MGPAPGPFHGVVAGHPLEGGDGRVGDGARGADGGGLDEVEDGGVARLREVVQSGAAGAFGAAAGGLDDQGQVVGSGDGGEAAGCGDVQFTAAFQGLLGPVEDGLDTPAGAGTPGAHLALPSVERALFMRRP